MLIFTFDMCNTLISAALKYADRTDIWVATSKSYLNHIEETYFSAVNDSTFHQAIICSELELKAFFLMLFSLNSLNIRGEICTRFKPHWERCFQFFYTPWKRQKTKGYLTFSRGIEELKTSFSMRFKSCTNFASNIKWVQAN